MYFNIAEMWKTVPDNKNITIKQNVLCPEKFQLHKIIEFSIQNIWETVPDS